MALDETTARIPVHATTATRAAVTAASVHRLVVLPTLLVTSGQPPTGGAIGAARRSLTAVGGTR